MIIPLPSPKACAYSLRPQACGVKDVKDISVAKSVEPSPNAVFWSKFTRPTGPPTAPTGAVKGALKKDIPAATSGAEACVDETGAIKNPALKPVTKVAMALKPAAAGGAPVPSIKDFPEEEPAPAASAWHSARRRLPAHSLTPSRVRCVGRRRLERLDQGVSRGGARPGGEHLPAPFCGVLWGHASPTGGHLH